MSALSDRTESASSSGLSSKASTSEVAFGWEDDGYSFVHQNAERQIIQLANNRVSLNSILKKYRVLLEEQYSITGWNHKGSCPFPDHNDNRPSFGYNSQEDRFNCFGCKRAGRAVEFIAFMEHRPRIQIARSIVGRVTPEEINAVQAQAFDRSRLKGLLFEYADILRAFKREHNNSISALQYAEDVTWNLDVYLNKHARHSTMILDELEARIEKLKAQLLLFEE